MPAQAITQNKGQLSVVYGSIPTINLTKESSITYEIGQKGDTVGSLKDVVHIFENNGSIVSTITISLPKNAPEILALDSFLLTNTPAPLVIKDNGLGITVGMNSAACSQVALSDTTGDSTLETISYSFKGNLSKVNEA